MTTPHSPVLIESDVPKIASEGLRFFARPGLAPLEITEPSIVTVEGQQILKFEIMNRLPLLLLSLVAVRFDTPGGEIWAVNRDPVGPFGRDEWQATVPSGATQADIRFGIMPFEIALVRKVVSLQQGEGP